METNTTKNFWSRPEGKTGMIVIALLLGAAGYLGFIFLPFIVATLLNATKAAILGISLFVLGFIVTDRKFQLRMKAIYQVAMKWLTGWIIELDPIAIIEGYLGTLEESLEKMSEQLNLLSGQESKLATKIKSNRSSVESSLSKASYAKDKLNSIDPQSVKYLEYKSAAVLEANNAQRLKASNEKLEEVLSKIINLRKILEKMNASAKFVLQDMTNEVKLKKEEREAVLKGYSAYKSAMKVLDGDKDAKALFDEAMEFMAEDLGNKVGEIQRFMENSGSILTSMDVDNEMIEIKGLNLIDEWEKKGDQIFITSPKEISRQNASIQVSQSTFVENRNTNTRNKYLN